jgi:hypothetical protein
VVGQGSLGINDPEEVIMDVEKLIMHPEWKYGQVLLKGATPGRKFFCALQTFKTTKVVLLALGSILPTKIFCSENFSVKIRKL